MPGYIEDRWWTKRPDPTTGKKRKTALYGKGKRYKVTGIAGVRARSFEKVADAERWKAKAQAQSLAGEFTDPRDGNLLLKTYVEDTWWPSLSADPSTLETTHRLVWKHVLPHLGHLPLRNITVATLRTWLKTLEPNLGAGTTIAAWSYFSNILEYAVDDGKIPKNPCKAKTVSPPAPPEYKARAWSRERVAAVRGALHERFRIMADLGAGAGLRQGEVLGLSVDDIDEEAGLLHIRRQVKKIGSKLVFALPKGGKTRTVPLPIHLARRLKAHLQQFPAQAVTLPWGDPRPPKTDRETKDRAPQTHRLVVTTVQGCAIRRDQWNMRYWKPALVAAGVIAPGKVVVRPNPERPGGGGLKVIQFEESREHGFHSLRHTFASVQLHARESVVAVSKWMGHADPSITLRIYAHFIPEANNRGRQVMDAWFESAPEKISLDSPWASDSPLTAPAVGPAVDAVAAG
ncbi:tyrosine-type recombinase/integrase [Streptomyces sp. NPDC001404]|uniref:tyrosine-type recombinase/integrase n=1 Tax=Streptomyces sp. NPDC001404 TaxID=3364571 RepID=UPI003685574B